MKLSDFDYSYPEDLVAQHPLPQRDAARMMIVDRAGSAARHAGVRDLPEFLRAGDVLVVNRSKVIPARLIGRKESGGTVEVLLLRPHVIARSPVLRGDVATSLAHSWWCLTSHTKRLKPGMRIYFPPFCKGGPGGVEHSTPPPASQGPPLTIGEVKTRNGNEVLIQFSCTDDFESILHHIGLPPLPPYIVRNDASDYSAEDRARYQTVFAREAGSAAAPTAGLHLTEDLMASLRHRGVQIAEVILHVGRDTFQPVRVENIADHQMHGEVYSIPAETAEIVNRAKHDGRRVIAVGTTTARALESAYYSGDTILNSGMTRIFITPGYHFRAIDGLLTNFHQPKSTLLMLVSALLGRDRALSLYAEAIREKYRLFSFGDCMLIT